MCIRDRAYTILAKWPESEETSIVENALGGKKQANGLWAWRLDTLNPGSATTIHFGVSGLRKGEWSDAEIFYRGNGEVIGATKIDEKLLEELRKSEALEAAESEFQNPVESISQLKERAEQSEGSQPLSLEGGQTSLFGNFSTNDAEEVE